MFMACADMLTGHMCNCLGEKQDQGCCRPTCRQCCRLGGWKPRCQAL